MRFEIEYLDSTRRSGSIEASCEDEARAKFEAGDELDDDTEIDSAGMELLSVTNQGEQ